MKKIFLASILAASSLMAQYKVITTTTGGYNGVGQEAFFGTMTDYTKERVKINNMLARGTVGAANGALSQGSNLLASGLQGAAVGAGISLVYGLMDPFIMDFYADQEYVLIKKDSSGELKAYYFIGDKHPSLTKEQIHEILKGM